MMKILSLIVSCFSGSYVRLWPEVFPEKPLMSTPVFDGRAVCYPSTRTLRDYLSWRQTDTHINNLVSRQGPHQFFKLGGGGGFQKCIAVLSVLEGSLIMILPLFTCSCNTT